MICFNATLERRKPLLVFILIFVSCFISATLVALGLCKKKLSRTIFGAHSIDRIASSYGSTLSCVFKEFTNMST